MTGLECLLYLLSMWTGAVQATTFSDMVVSGRQKQWVIKQNLYRSKHGFAFLCTGRTVWVHIPTRESTSEREMVRMHLWVANVPILHLRGRSAPDAGRCCKYFEELMATRAVLGKDEVAVKRNTLTAARVERLVYAQKKSTLLERTKSRTCSKFCCWRLGHASWRAVPQWQWLVNCAYFGKAGQAVESCGKKWEAWNQCMQVCLIKNATRFCD